MKAKRPGPIITFVLRIDSENMRESMFPGMSRVSLCPSLPFVFYPTSTATVNSHINSPQETPGIWVPWCYHRLSKTVGKKPVPQWNLIFKPATINTALKFDNRELWQKIIRFVVKAQAHFLPSLWFILSL